MGRKCTNFHRFISHCEHLWNLSYHGSGNAGKKIRVIFKPLKDNIALVRSIILHSCERVEDNRG